MLGRHQTDSEKDRADDIELRKREREREDDRSLKEIEKEKITLREGERGERKIYKTQLPKKNFKEN